MVQRRKISKRWGSVNTRVVWDRDKGVCQYCGYPAEAVDHVIPWSYMHDNSLDNLVLACNRCNTVASSLVFNGFVEKRDFILSKRRPEMIRDLENWEPNE